MADIIPPAGYRLRDAAPIEPTPVPSVITPPAGFTLRGVPAAGSGGGQSAPPAAGLRQPDMLNDITPTPVPGAGGMQDTFQETAPAPIVPTPPPQGPGIAEQVGQNLLEVGKGIPAGAGSLVGSALIGAGTNLQQSNYDQLALMDRIDRGETVPEMEDPAAYQYMTPEQRQQFRQQVQQGVDTPIVQLPLVQAGQAVNEGSNLFPAAPGYEASIGRQAGEGLGSVAGGVAAAMVPGAGPVLAPAIYTESGSGQAAMQAMQDPKATRQQVVQASLAGAAPGATDVLPLETLLSAVPLPGARALSKVPGVIGSMVRGGARMLGQTGVEAVQEGGQQLLQNEIAREVYNPDQNLMEGVGTNVAQGGGVGVLSELGRALIEALMPGHPAAHRPGVPTESVQQQAAAPPGVAPVAAEGDAISPTAATPQGVQQPNGAPPAAVAPGAAAVAAEAAPVVPTGPNAADLPMLNDAWSRLVEGIGTADPTPQETQLRSELETQIVAAGGRVPNPQPIVEAARAREAASLKQGMDKAATSGVPVPDIIATEKMESTLPGEEIGYRDAVRAVQSAGSTSVSALRAQMRVSATRAREMIDRMRSEGLLGEPKNGRIPFVGEMPQAGAGTQDNPVEANTGMAVDQAARMAEDPTAAQAEAGNYQQGHMVWDGLPITIETPRGGERSGVDDAGNPWSTTLPAHYGYIKTSPGADGEKLDVYIGPNPQAPDVFVVDQIDPATGDWDEAKSLIGFPSETDAIAAYDGSFSDGSGPSRRGAVSAMPRDDFTHYLDRGVFTQPFAYDEDAALQERLANGGSRNAQASRDLSAFDTASEQGDGFIDRPGIRAPSSVGGGNAVALENSPDAGLGHAAGQGNFGDGRAEGAHLGGRGQGPLPGASVAAPVLGLSHDLQVGGRVVQPVPINMVDDLRRKKGPPQDALHNDSMLKPLLPPVVNQAVQNGSAVEGPDVSASVGRSQSGSPEFDDGGASSEFVDLRTRPPSYTDDLNDSLDDFFFSEPTAQGQQNLIPVVAPVTDADRLAVEAARPLAPTATQQPADEGLFDVAGRGQQDLVPQAPTAPPAAAPRRKGKKPTLVDRMENYFQPGREIPSYGGGTDYVVSFNRGDGEHWTVTVRDTKTGHQRSHETVPDKRPLERWEKEHSVGGAPVAQQVVDPGAVPDRVPFWTEAVKRYRSQAVKKSDSLIGFLRQRGGLKRTGPSGQEVRAALKDANLPPGTFNAKGMNADDAALAAWQAGYFPGTERPDLQTFYDALGREARGEAVHTAINTVADQEQQAFVASMDKALDAAGATIDMTDQQIAERLAQQEHVEQMMAGAIPFADNPAGWGDAGGGTDQASEDMSDATFSLAQPRRDQMTPEMRRIADVAQRVINRIMPSARLKAGGVVSLNGNPRTSIEGASTGDGTIIITRYVVNPANIAGHEAFHAMREMGLFTPEEWATLEAAAPAWREQHGIDSNGMYQGLSEDSKNEEGIARAYGDWSAGTDKAVPTKVQAIFTKIKTMLAAVRRAVRTLLGNSADIQDIFSKIDSGEIGRRPTGTVAFDRAVFAATPQSPAQQQAQANQMGAGTTPPRKRWGDIVMGGPKLPNPHDLIWPAKYLATPYHIASVDTDFEPVFDAQLDMNERRSRLATMLFRVLEPYFRASTKDKEAVNAALEMGRLERQNYNGLMIQVTNPGHHKHAIVPPGQTITLTQGQSNMYRAVRHGMDLAVRSMRNQFLIEQGFGNPGDPRTPGQFRALAASATTGREQAKLARIADTLDTINEAQQTGYVPFTRYGNRYLNVRDVGGNLVHSEKVEGGINSRRRAQRIRQKLETMYPAGQFRVDDWQYGADPRKDLGLDRLDFEALGRLAEQGGADPMLRQAYEDALREGLNQSGFRAHFIKSSNLPGYSQDFERSIADYVLGMSGYLARRATRKRLQLALDSIPPAKRRLKAYSEEYARYTTTPTEEFQKLRSWMFYAHLAGNISSAIVNMTQVPLVSFPWLTMTAGMPRATAHLAKAGADVALAFRPRLAADTLYFDVDKLPAADRADMQALLDEGTLVPQATIEQMGVAQSKSRKVRGIKKRTQQVTGLLGTAFSAAERYNRMVTALAALRMGRDPAVQRLAMRSLKGNAIAASKAAVNNGVLQPLDFARLAVDETQIVQGKVNRPAVTRGMGAAILQFQQFTMNMLMLQKRMLSNYGGRGKAAFALQMGLMTMAAGLLGMPGADDLRALIESILQLAGRSDVDLEKEMKTALDDIAGGEDASQLGKLAAEAVRRGLFRSAGVDIGRRVGMGNITPGSGLGRDATGWEHLANMSPAGSVPLKLIEAFGHWQQGDNAAAAASVAPFFLSAGAGNAAKAYLMSQQGQRSSTGSMLIPPGKITGGDVALRALGFQSTHLARAFEDYNMMNRADRAMSEITADYAQAIAVARVRGDSAAETAMRQEISLYNQGKDPAAQIVITPQRQNAAIKREREGIYGKSRPHRTATERERIEQATPKGLIYDALGGSDETGATP